MLILKKLLKIILWLIGSGILLVVLALAGTYLYFAIQLEEQFAKLDAKESTDCATSNRWQIFTPIEAYPTQFLALFESINRDIIDDQLARMLTNDGVRYRSLERRTHSLVGLLEIKRHYLPQERLELAMKHAYMGQNGECSIHGIGAATQHYFGKIPAQLSVAEIALLVGLAKGASYYNPFRNLDRALERRNHVLKMSLNDKLITEAEYQTALNEPLPAEPHLP